MPSFTSTAAVIKMNSDGSVVVNIALTEIGQGTATVVTQMAADRLRFPVSRVKVAVERDTDKDPFDWQTVASKGLLLTGNAVIAACDDSCDRPTWTRPSSARANRGSRTMTVRRFSSNSARRSQ